MINIPIQSVIELGSGCGLAGIAYMLRGAEVAFTDLPEVVNALTERNALVCSSYPNTKLKCTKSLIILDYIFSSDHFCKRRVHFFTSIQTTYGISHRLDTQLTKAC